MERVELHRQEESVDTGRVLREEGKGTLLQHLVHLLKFSVQKSLDLRVLEQRFLFHYKLQERYSPLKERLKALYSPEDTHFLLSYHLYREETATVEPISSLGMGLYYGGERLVHIQQFLMYLSWGHLISVEPIKMLSVLFLPHDV